MAKISQDIIETKVPVSQLAIGMHVVRLDRPWEETNFLLQGFVIQNDGDIAAVQEQCDYVFIEGRIDIHYSNTPSGRARQASGTSQAGARKIKTVETKLETQIPKKRVNYINKVDTRLELSSAKAHYKDAKATAKNIMSSIRLGRMLEMNQVQRAVDQTVDSVLRNENALLLLSKIKNKDEYTAEHCINVAILAAAFGKHLGMLKGEIRKLALCGMLHDVGKMRIDDTILNKPGALTPDEFDIMKHHTTYGRDVLAALPSMDHAAVDVAYAHHERMDGKGYPRGLPSHQIPLLAKMVGVVDTYDAITSSRVYDKGRASMEALQIIHKNKGKQFDAELAVEFIQMIGVYPPGSIVEMTNEEVGVVVANNKNSKLKPLVLMVRDAKKNPLPEYVELDLARKPRDSSGEVYTIAREVPDETYGIVLKEFIENGYLSHQASELSSLVDNGHGES